MAKRTVRNGGVEITLHAMQRLQERVGSYDGYKSWQHLVKTARYQGRDEQTMTEYEYEWCSTNIKRLYRHSQVRMLDGYAFLFMGNKGHARTLVTVITVENVRHEAEAA